MNFHTNKTIDSKSPKEKADDKPKRNRPNNRKAADNLSKLICWTHKKFKEKATKCLKPDTCPIASKIVNNLNNSKD